MDRKKEKFVCPHCNEVMDVDMIYLHVRRIFNSALYKCRQCDFSTNDTFHRDHHKSVTGHRLDDKNDLVPLLEEAISSTATLFMNSVVGGNESRNVVKSVTKSKETEKTDSPKQPIDGNETPIIARKTGNSDQKRKFFLNTIISINTMSFEYEKENNSSKAVEAVEISSGARLPKQKYNIPLPSFGRNKTILCQKCKKEVHESYLSRRKHVFREHQDDIMHKLKDLKTLKKTDILFKGFMTIRDCFPDYVVCSDFQCIDCGCYYCSISGVRYHVGVSHQKSIMINCPFENCDFKTGSNCHVKDHIRIHMKGIVNKRDEISIRDLASYVSPQSYATFNSSCKSESQITKNISKHYFPINMSYYDNFQNDFKEALSEFKKCYLQPHVLNGLIFANQEMNESEIIPSNNGIIEESDDDTDVSEGSMLEKNNISSRKRKNDNSISECNDVVFLKEKTLNSKMSASLEVPTSSGFSIINYSSPKSTFSNVTSKKNIEKALENDKVEKFTKEIPPFETVARNFLQNNNNNSKVKEEIVSRPTSSLNLKKVKTEITALPPESRGDRSYKDSVYETIGRRGEEMRSKSRQRDFSRGRSYSKSYSYYNDNRRHSSTSRNYDNSQRYLKYSRNQK